MKLRLRFHHKQRLWGHFLQRAETISEEIGTTGFGAYLLNLCLSESMLKSKKQAQNVAQMIDYMRKCVWLSNMNAIKYYFKTGIELESNGLHRADSVDSTWSSKECIYLHNGMCFDPLKK